MMTKVEFLMISKKQDLTMWKRRPKFLTMSKKQEETMWKTIAKFLTMWKVSVNPDLQTKYGNRRCKYTNWGLYTVKQKDGVVFIQTNDVDGGESKVIMMIMNEETNG